MDIFSKKVRSHIMSRVKSQDSKYEILVRKMLFKKGYRFRKNVKKLPGKPDIVLKKYHLIIFIHGCFWHGHKPCPNYTLPKTHVSFWRNKVKTNQKRDRLVARTLKKMGWRVVSLWECKLRKNIEREFGKIEKVIHRENINGA